MRPPPGVFRGCMNTLADPIERDLAHHLRAQDAIEARANAIDSIVEELVDAAERGESTDWLETDDGSRFGDRVNRILSSDLPLDERMADIHDLRNELIGRWARGIAEQEYRGRVDESEESRAEEKWLDKRSAVPE